jgi:hypothetical protein
VSRLSRLDPDRPSSKAWTVSTAPGETFGSLCILGDGRTDLEEVREAVVRSSSIDGARPVDGDAYRALPTEDEDFLCDLAVNTSPRLGADLVVLDPEIGRWIGVLSEHWELTPQGRHPLALRLSARWPVLSITATEEVAYELCLYEDGRPRQYAAHGQPAEPDPVGVPLDFRLLADCSPIEAGAEELRAAFGNPRIFANLAGIASGGIRHLFEGTDLDGLPEDHLLFLAGS